MYQGSMFCTFPIGGGGGGGANMRTAGRANHNCRDKVYYYGFHR